MWLQKPLILSPNGVPCETRLMPSFEPLQHGMFLHSTHIFASTSRYYFQMIISWKDFFFLRYGAIWKPRSLIFFTKCLRIYLLIWINVVYQAELRRFQKLKGKILGWCRNGTPLSRNCMIYPAPHSRTQIIVLRDSTPQCPKLIVLDHRGFGRATVEGYACTYEAGAPYTLSTVPLVGWKQGVNQRQEGNKQETLTYWSQFGHLLRRFQSGDGLPQHYQADSEPHQK